MRFTALVRSAVVLLLLACTVAVARADYVGDLDPYGDNFLALRTGPGTDYRMIRRLGPDTIVTVLERDGRWRLIELDDGTQGWAYGAYILPGLPPGWEDQGPGDDETVSPPDDDVVVPPDEETEPPPVSDDAAVPEIGRWTVYSNDRYGTSIEYPAAAFVALPPPDNDDGLSFKARIGTARFMVFASQNVFDMTLPELMEDDIAGSADDTVTYKRSGEDWYVLSGYRGSDVFYRKVLLSGGSSQVNTFEITYPKSQKSVFDPVAARMAKSLSAGTGVSDEEAPPPVVEPPSDDEVAAPPSDEDVSVEPEPQPPEIAQDAWRAPLEETLFDGTPTPLFLPHQAHGGVFDTSARYEDGELVVDVPANSGWGKVGLLSNDPLVWMDDFHDDAETRVTFALDPQRTTGFGLALAQPGWGGVAGNDPGYPDVRFYWIRNPDGKDARVEMHVDPHGTDDFWKGSVGPTAPRNVTFILRPGAVSVALDGKTVAERPWPALRSGIGFRVYAFSHPADVNLPARLGLKSITVARIYPTAPEPTEPAPGVEPLPVETLFDGAPTPAFEPAAVAGGDFDAFARYIDGGLDIDVPAGHSWGKTGLISAEPLVVLDNRAYETAMRLTLTVDPARTGTFVLALAGDKVVEMWPSHNAWFVLSRLPDEDSYLLQANAGPYNDRVRKIPAAWFDAHWDGRIQYDIGQDFGCIRIPDGPSLCAQLPTSVGNRLYATILAHAPAEGRATGLVLKQITRGLVTPPGLTADHRWFFVDDNAFDADQYLKDLGSLLP